MVKQFATTSLRPQNWWTIRWVENPGVNNSLGGSSNWVELSGGQSRSGGNNHESLQCARYQGGNIANSYCTCSVKNGHVKNVGIHYVFMLRRQFYSTGLGRQQKYVMKCQRSQTLIQSETLGIFPINFLPRLQ